MLIDTSTVFAMRCPECGQLQLKTLSLFSFSGCRVLDVKCSCGVSLLNIKKLNNGGYRLQLPCVICEYKHQRQISNAQMWSKKLTTLYCLETGLELGHIGPRAEVQQAVTNSNYDLESLLEQFEGDDYFNNSSVMYQVINSLHDIAEKSALYCQCGNESIELDIYPDRVELQCKQCGSINIVYAETEEDLKVIQQVEYIELAQNGFKFLDSLADNNGKSKSRKNRRKRNKHH